MGDRPTILSTRSLRPTALALAEKQGIDCLCVDFIETVLLKNPELENAAAAMDDPYIFTSAHGVEGALQYEALVRGGEAPRKIYCLEGATLQAAARQPNWRIAATAPDAASLAEKILSAEEPLSQAAFFCGRQHLDVLPERLRQAGIRLKEYIVYDTRPAGHRVDKDFQAILFFSPSGVESFFRLNQLPAALPCFCIGSTTAAALAVHGEYRAVLAARPSQESVMEAAVNYLLTVNQSKQ